MDAVTGTLPSDSKSNDDTVGRLLELWTFRLLLGGIFGIAFSIVLGQLLLAVSIILFVVALLSRKLRVALPRILIATAAFAAVALLATLTGPNTQEGLRSMHPLLWYAAIPVTATMVSSPRRLRQLLYAFALGCLVLSLKIFVLRSCEAWDLCAENVLWTHAGFLATVVHLGSMTDGQMLMMGIVVTAGLLFATHGEKRNQLLWWLVLGLLVVAQLANFKRGSWMVTVAMLGLLVILRTNWKYLLLLLTAVIMFGFLPPVRARLAGLKGEFNVEDGGRLTMWVKLTPGFIKKHPLGVGYGAMTEQMMQDEANSQGIRVERERNHLHSNPAQVLVETGWAGLAVYLVWMGWALWTGARLAMSARGCPVPEQVCALLPFLMLLGLLANGLIEFNFGDTELVIVYAVVMGLSVSRRNSRSADDLSQLTQEQSPA